MCWYFVTGDQNVVWWQVSQGDDVMMCRAGRPSALLPLWQLAHVPVRLRWSTRAPANILELLWQVSHGAVVAICFAGFPMATEPLWHLVQFATRFVWSGLPEGFGLPGDGGALAAVGEPVFVDGAGADGPVADGPVAAGVFAAVAAVDAVVVVVVGAAATGPKQLPVKLPVTHTPPRHVTVLK
jgi:hypothetical protein